MKKWYEITLAYTDNRGVKRFLNHVGTLWMDGERGHIEIKPGIALVGGKEHWINVEPPRAERTAGAGQHRERAAGGASTGATDGDDIPF